MKHTEDILEQKRQDRHLSTQYAVSGALAESTDLEDLAPKILRIIAEGLGWDYAAIWTPDRRGRMLRCVDIWHTPAAEFPEFGAISRRITFAPGSGLPGRVWESREPTWIADVLQDADFARLGVAASEGLHAASAFPIILGGRLLGVFEFFSREARSPDRHALDLMASLGGQIGQFIERRRAEEAVRESEALKSAVLESALDAIITMDHEGTVVEFNPAAERIFGYPRDETIGREMAELIIPPSLRERHRQGLGHYLSTGDGPAIGQRLELPAMRSDGAEFPVELTITRIPYDGPPMFTGYVRDITERKQAEKDKEDLLARVEGALKLRNQFMSMASHELKTPITLLKGYAQVLCKRAQKQGDEGMLGPLNVIGRQVERMNHLIDTLLDVSRIEAGVIQFEMAPVELNAVVHEVTGDFRITSPDFEFHMHEDAPGLWVRADRMRIQQVVTNLLTNAVKYSDGCKQVDLSIGRDGDRARVSVTDYGIGVPLEQQPHVFELYFRGANASASHYGGLGLGLYISSTIIDRHGGNVGLVSEPGKGSTFHFSLPLIDTGTLAGGEQG